MSDAFREPPEPELIPRPQDAPTEALGAPPETGVEPASDQTGLGPAEQPPPASRPQKRRMALLLFLLTCGSTFYAGREHFREHVVAPHPVTGQPIKLWRVDSARHRAVPVTRPSSLNGLMYAAGIMLILGAHEMGHYLQAVRYRVPASLPMFIPMPITPFGTMGAVIVQEPGAADRKAMFDIAISGPLAGLVVALPLNWWAIQHSQIAPIAPGGEGWTNPLIVEWMIGMIHHPLKPGEDIVLTPLVFAGWVGIFITGLNLIPIGQLDGGHILYCLVGRRAHRIARGLFLGAVAVVLFNLWRGQQEYASWTLMLVLIWLMGTRHPPTANDRVPLGAFRILLGWLTLAFILVGFVPTPTYRNTPPAQHPAPIERVPAEEILI